MSKDTKQEDNAPTPVTTTPMALNPKTVEKTMFVNKEVLPKMKKIDPEEPGHLPLNEKFMKRWLIEGLIGKGGYGEIYLALDVVRGEEVAIKVEPKKRRGKLAKRMILEQHVLAKMQGKPHVPMIYGSGHAEKYNFISKSVFRMKILKFNF